MISDQGLALLCQGDYAADAIPTWNTADVHVFLHTVGRAAVVNFKGSVSANDWWRDFQAIPATPTLHPSLGLVHPAFMADVDEVRDQINSAVSGHDEFYIIGHSKGAGEAQDYAALETMDLRSFTRLCIWAPPHVGFLAGTLWTTKNGIAYRYRSDPVPEEPRWIAAAMPLRQCGADDVFFGMIECHHIQNYVNVSTT